MVTVFAVLLEVDLPTAVAFAPAHDADLPMATELVVAVA
jgi:hypothetical protein